MVDGLLVILRLIPVARSRHHELNAMVCAEQEDSNERSFSTCERSQ
jgi:hypothetical protein